MKRQKNGFTLIEVLAVLVVLGILIAIAVPNVIKIIGKQQDTVTEHALKDLKDAAVSYASANVFLKACADGFEPSSINSTSVNGCTVKLSVEELVKKQYFRDDSNHCNHSAYVLVYRYINKKNGNDIDEFRAYADESICFVD